MKEAEIIIITIVLWALIITTLAGVFGYKTGYGKGVNDIEIIIEQRVSDRLENYVENYVRNGMLVKTDFWNK